MRVQMEKRLEELEAELAAGEKLLAELAEKQASVKQTLLRISGARQVLRELLGPQPRTNEHAPVASGEASTHP